MGALFLILPWALGLGFIVSVSAEGLIVCSWVAAPRQPRFEILQLQLATRQTAMSGRTDKVDKTFGVWGNLEEGA